MLHNKKPISAMFRCHQLGGHCGRYAGPASHRILNTNFALTKPKFRKNILKTHRPVIDLKRPFYSMPLLLNVLSLFAYSFCLCRTHVLYENAVWCVVSPSVCIEHNSRLLYYIWKCLKIWIRSFYAFQFGQFLVYFFAFLPCNL